MNYVLVYVPGTDEDPLLQTVAADKLEERIKELKLTRWDYALIKGDVVKDFDSLVDFKKLFVPSISQMTDAQLGERMKQVMQSSEIDWDRVKTGNQAACARIRKKMQEIKNLANERILRLERTS